jgi:hypothetical protein
MGLSFNLKIILILPNSFLKMTEGLPVLNQNPELMNIKNLDFAKPKLFFKTIDRYAANSQPRTSADPRPITSTKTQR